MRIGGLAVGAVLVAAGCATTDNAEYGLPTTVTYESPLSVVTNAHGRVFVDFGKDAFGWLELMPPSGFTGGVYQVAVSEMKHPDDTTDRWADGTIRSIWNLPTVLTAEEKVHRIEFVPDERNTDFARAVPPVKLRPEVGVVWPFRYAEFFAVPFEVNGRTLRRAMVHYPIDMGESSFACSDERLTKVYDFCKYSILATSFAGLYVDGDRERIPYEADAYINQHGHYAISSDGRLARASHEYLLRHPTWPTEWKQHSIMMAWADWMWTGETNGLARAYDLLKNEKLLLARARPDGLLTSPLEALTGPNRACDLIDWPPRDRDGYVFRPVSAVINAFHYRNLCQMSDMARALGKADDADWFATRAKHVRESYNRVFRDPADGFYRDGEGTGHKGFHAQVAALAFGLVPDADKRRVAEALVKRGMVCSVYYAQYLLEALYAAGCEDAALALMVADSDRSWLGMLRQGATITMEAWNRDDKPNLDWNHAWGTPPLNVISRYVLGVTPLEPGFAKISVKPQVGGLESMKGTVPTARGRVEVEVKGGRLSVSVPAPAKVVWKGRTHEVPAGRHQFE